MEVVVAATVVVAAAEEEEARIITCPRIPIAISKSIIKLCTVALAATSTTCRPLRNSTSWPHACLLLRLRLLRTSIINTTRTITPTHRFTITTITIRTTTITTTISWLAILWPVRHRAISLYKLPRSA